MNATRQAVYAAINGERAYQDAKWDPANPDVSGRHTCLEWFVYMEDYIAEAKRILSRQPEKQAREFALHTTRKIAAMAVCSMEQNGIRIREDEGSRPVGFVQT
jgi:hypothetical protein